MSGSEIDWSKAQMSGPPMQQFREGWCIVPFVGAHGKPHYWRRDGLSNRYSSECGMQTSLATRETLIARGFIHAQSGILPFAEGDFKGERCKNCERKRRLSLKPGEQQP